MSDIQALEAQIAARQVRLSGTIDELASRVSPQSLLTQNVDLMKSRFATVARTEAGDLRVERVVAVVGVVVVAIALRAWGGRRRRARRG